MFIELHKPVMTGKHLQILIPTCTSSLEIVFIELHKPAMNTIKNRSLKAVLRELNKLSVKQLASLVITTYVKLT